MKCPKDNSPLEPFSVKSVSQTDIHLDICKECQGVWVDRDELGSLVSTFSADVQKTYQTWLVASTDGKTQPKDFWSEGEKNCPRDGTKMQKHYSSMAHLVGIEQCQKCAGFWFDGSELYAVAKMNESNQELDNAISGSLTGLQTELQDNYNFKDVQWWDVYSRPETALPYITNLFLDLMVTFVARK